MCSTPGLPTAGTVVPVLITGVNLKHGSGIVELWVNMDDDKKHIYEQMRGEIQDPDRKFAGPEGEPGDLCLVCIDGVWHRAQIVSIQGDTCNVFLIDQGQPHITRSKALAWGHTDSFLLPPETESCILANVLLLDNIWPERAIKFLMSLHGKKFKGLVQHVLKPNRTLLLDIPMVSKPMCMFGVAKKMPVDEFKCLVQKCLEVDRITQEPNLNVGRKLEKIDQYFYPDLLTNSYEAVIVTEVNNPRNIFCKLNIFSKAVKMISEQMQQHYENDSGETGPSNCGDPCAAKGTDGRWHRSLLRQTLTNDGTVQVFHVDEGKVEMVPVGGIRPLHRDFLRMPVVTYSCSLQGVTDDRMAKTSYLKSLLLNQTHMAKFSHHNKPQDVYQVILYANGGVCINNSFIEKMGHFESPEQHLNVQNMLLSSSCVSLLLDDHCMDSTLNLDVNGLLDETKNQSVSGWTDEPTTGNKNREEHPPPQVQINGHLPTEVQNAHDAFAVGSSVGIGKRPTEGCPPLPSESYNYSTHNIKVNGKEKVWITSSENVNLFYCQLNRNYHLFEKVMEDVKQLLGKQRCTDHPLGLNSICFAKYSDKQWYRGQVVELSPKLRVHFVDYGQTLLVNECDICPCPTGESMCRALPVQAVPLGLFNVPADVPQEVSNWFADHAIGQNLSISVVAKGERGKLIVELFDGFLNVNAKVREKISKMRSKMTTLVQKTNQQLSNKSQHASKPNEDCSTKVLTQMTEQNPCARVELSSQPVTKVCLPEIQHEKTLDEGRKPTSDFIPIDKKVEKCNDDSEVTQPSLPSCHKGNVNISMYSWLTISESKTVELYASCISGPHFFWCQYTDEEEANKVASLAQEAGLAQQDRTFPESLCPGSPCLALDSNDGQWYRAQVLRRVEDKFDVVFVDYGNESDVDIKNVRSVPQSLLEIAPQAFLCSLKGFDQSSGSWDDQVHDVFYNLLVDKPLNVTVLNKEELSDSVLPQYAVEIVCENVIMNTVMQKYWTPLPTEQAKPEIAQTETSLQDLEKESNKDLEKESDKDTQTESDKDNQKESNKDLETESDKDNQTESDKDNQTESDKDNQKESNKDLDTESNKDLDTESNKDNQTESNKDLDTESNKDLDTESNKDNQTESNKDLDTESNKELETESNKDNQTESDKDNQTESDKDNQKESNKDLETESDKDNQTESDKDNQTESDKDNQKESNKDLDTESNKDLDTESNKDLDTESNKDLDTESNKDNQTESNKDLDTESNKDLDTESNKDNQTESIKDLDTESNKDLDTESNKDNQTESNKDLDTESNKDLDSESNKDNQTESNKDLDTESNKDLDTKSNKDNQTESNKDLDTESNKDLDTESNKDNQTESNKDLDTESNKDNQMESNKDLDTESNKDLDTDSNKDDQKESNKDLDTESNKDDQTESNKDLDTESNKDDQTESNKDLDTESNKDDQTESNKDLDTESNKDLDTDSNKDDQTESNKDLDTESNKDLDTDSNKDDQTESNKDLDTESNKDNQMESNKDLDTESSIDLETESSISHLGVDKLNVNTCMYKKPNISKNQQEVYASCISDPHFFWCQYSDEEEANKVTSLAQEAGLAQQDRTFPESLCPGSPCLALDSSDGQWYRAQVLRRVEDKFDVVFVDHGNKSDVDIKNVRSVPQSLLEIALQAFLCSPKGFDQSRGSWHDQVHNVFYNLLVDNPLNVTVLNKEELSDSVLPQYAVEIVCENVIMNTVMQKYWTPLPTEQAKPEIAQTETSLQDLEKESNKDLETESDKDLDTESSIDLETESDKDTQKESNKELETESNKDLDTKSSIDLETESDKDTQKESNKELETESNKDLDTKSSMDLETESSISHLGVDKLNVNTCMYKKPNISKNQQEVYASCISDPHFFWCQYTDEEEANKVTSLAQEAGLAQQDRTFPESLCPGSPCLALDSSDGQWYRAQVLRRVEDKFDVVFVDYGNKSDVDIKNVRSVPQSLLEIAPQAFLCSLKGFDQSRGSWDDQVHDVFYNLLVDNPLKVTVLDMVGHSEAGHPQYAVEVECEGEVVNALMQTYWNGLDTGQASGICLEWEMMKHDEEFLGLKSSSKEALDPDETQT
ncbi:tudor domain-containing 6 [Eleginops maclovinus]|uniref:tudor domain-containing 6 n=1 Tax=Eleginops maclovinus TaxID=56733 RepID=UPI00307FE1C6